MKFFIEEALVSRDPAIFVERSSEILFFSTNIRPRNFPSSRTWYIFARDIEKCFELGSCTKPRTKASQNKVNPSLFSLLPRLHPSFHFLSFRSWSPVCILELGRYATYNRQTSRFLNETSCRSCTFRKEQKGVFLVPV